MRIIRRKQGRPRGMGRCMSWTPAPGQNTNRLTCAERTGHSGLHNRDGWLWASGGKAYRRQPVEDR